MSHSLIWMAMECKHNHQHLPKPSFFVDKIFKTYSNQTLNYSLISYTDFEKMYTKLAIHAEEHDHGHEHKSLRVTTERKVLFQERDEEFESVTISFLIY